MDVIKTRRMNSKPNEFKNLWEIIVYTAKLGPLGFYKGVTVSALRLVPANIILFLLLEKLTQNFGYVPQNK